MKILHLEDNPRDAELARHLLTGEWPGCTITLVENREALLRALGEGGYDIVLSDYQMPGFDGLEALDLVRERAPHIPFIFLTGTLGEERAIETVRAGAADYVIKDRMQRLPFSIQRVLREAEEQRSRRHIEEALAQEQYLLLMLMENLPDTVYFKDAGSRFISFSRSMARKVGRTPSEVKGKTDFDFFTEEHARKAFEDEQGIIRTGQPLVDIEEKETWPDGTVTWSLTTKLPMRDAAGKIVGTFGVSRDITERKRKDDSLRLFRELVERSNDAFEVVDPATARFLDVNEKDCVELGYSRTELLNLRLYDVDLTIKPETWPAIIESIRTKGSISGEGIHRRKDGTTFPVEFNAKLVRLEREYLVTVVRNIAERRNAEARLRLQGSALESAANAIVIADRAGNIEWVNPAFTTLTGYSAAEAIGRNPNELVKSGRQDETFYKHLWETILRGEVWKSELINRRKDGTLYTESQTITPVRDEQGQINHFIAIKEDITSRKQAEERIREQADVIDQTPIAIIITNLSHHVTYCNAVALALYGLPREKIVGHAAEEIFSAETLEQFKAARLATFTTGRWVGEIKGYTKAGRELHAETHMSLINDAAGRPRARLTIAIDVTEKKKLEAQFLRAQRLESLGMLAAGIAHDLNNVLAPVLMGAPLLRIRATHPSDLRVLETIENSAGRGAALVRQILSFAHGASGERALIQVKHLLRDVGSLIEETFPKSIKLEEDIPNDLWTVHGNPTQLHQVLLNLCVNARDAMPQGGLLRLHAENRMLDVRTARTYPEANPGAYLMLEVTDTGTGITPEVLAHIWDPFFTTKGEGKGTGLGLVTVRGIAAGHGGFATVETEPGRGSTFRIFLRAEQSATEPAVASAHPSLVRGQGELVLVVDDEVSIRDLITTILSRFGYRVVAAANGIEAMALYAPRVKEVALIITDLGMPEMGGSELGLALSRLNPAVRILYMSGANEKDGEGRLMRGPSRFMSKPFTAEQLLASVHETLEIPGAPKPG